MNKLVKLPLFLGICGAACAGVLAGVYAFTNPIVEANTAKAAAESYVSMYSAYGVTTEDVKVEQAITLSDELFNVGCSSRAIVEKANGIAYTCSVSGFNGTISFQVAFAEGSYIAYTDLGQNETGGYGDSLIDHIIKLFKQKPSADNKPGDLYDYTVTTDAYSKCTFTGKPISDAIEACRQDYLAWYNAPKGGSGNE